MTLTYIFIYVFFREAFSFSDVNGVGASTALSGTFSVSHIRDFTELAPRPIQSIICHVRLSVCLSLLDSTVPTFSQKFPHGNFKFLLGNHGGVKFTYKVN